MDKREVLDELTLEEKAHLLVGERFLELGRLPKKGIGEFLMMDGCGILVQNDPEVVPPPMS